VITKVDDHISIVGKEDITDVHETNTVPCNVPHSVSHADSNQAWDFVEFEYQDNNDIGEDSFEDHHINHSESANIIDTIGVEVDNNQIFTTNDDQEVIYDDNIESIKPIKKAVKYTKKEPVQRTEIMIGPSGDEIPYSLAPGMSFEPITVMTMKKVHNKIVVKDTSNDDNSEENVPLKIDKKKSTTNVGDIKNVKKRSNTEVGGAVKAKRQKAAPENNKKRKAASISVQKEESTLFQQVNIAIEKEICNQEAVNPMFTTSDIQEGSNSHKDISQSKKKKSNNDTTNKEDKKKEKSKKKSSKFKTSAEIATKLFVSKYYTSTNTKSDEKESATYSKKGAVKSNILTEDNIVEVNNNKVNDSLGFNNFKNDILTKSKKVVQSICKESGLSQEEAIIQLWSVTTLKEREKYILNQSSEDNTLQPTANKKNNKKYIDKIIICETDKENISKNKKIGEKNNITSSTDKHVGVVVSQMNDDSDDDVVSSTTTNNKKVIQNSLFDNFGNKNKKSVKAIRKTSSSSSR
jgi:hypothetical protein